MKPLPTRTSPQGAPRSRRLGLSLQLAASLAVPAWLPASAASPREARPSATDLIGISLTNKVDLTNTVPILTNDVPVEVFQFGLTFATAPGLRVAEGSVSVPVDVLRLGPATNTATVEVRSTDGTATAGADYSPVHQTLVFGPGVFSQPITVTARGDSLSEGDEFFTLNLSVPSGAVLGAPASQRVTIHDTNVVIEPPLPADLSLSLSAAATAAVDEILDLHLTLLNSGPGSAGPIAVRDVLPPSLAWLGSVPGGTGDVYTPESGLWTIPALAAGSSIQLTLHVRAVAAGTVSNVAEVIASTVVDPDSMPGNGQANEDDLAIVVFQIKGPPPPPSADLAVEKDAGIEITLPGGRKDVEVSTNPTVLVTKSAVFLIRVRNLGPDEAKTITMKDTLPAGFTITADAPPAGTAFNRARGEWTIPTLANGDSLTLRLDAVTSQIGAWVNRATVNAVTADPIPGNNAAAAPVRVVGASLCGLAALCSSTNTPNTNAAVTISRAGKTFRTQTDARGRFCIDNLVPGRYVVEIEGNSASGVLPVRDDNFLVDGEPNIRPVDGEPLIHEFIHEVLRIRGQVTQGGRPVAGQKVLGFGDAEAVVAETDAQGFYQLVGFLAGEQVTVRPGLDVFPGGKFTPAEVKLQFAANSPCELKADFVLTGGLTLAGRLQACDKTGPFIQDAEITLSTATQPALARVRTGADGRFAVTNLPPDTYTLVASHPTYTFANPLGRIVLKSDTKPELFFGQPNGGVSGRVVNLDGTGVAGIVVNLVQDFRPFGVASTTTTDSDGRFQFLRTAAPVGNYVLFPKAPRDGVTFTPDRFGFRLGGTGCHAFVQFRTRESVAEIVALEVVQVTQNWQNGAPLVAGKPTLVRAFLRAPDGANRRIPVSNVRLQVTGDGGTATVRPKEGRGINASNDYLTRRNDPATSLAFEIPTNRCQGRVTFTLEWTTGSLKTAALPGQTAVKNNATTVTFQNVNELPVLWSLVSWARGGKTGSASLADLNRHRNRIYHNLPIHRIAPPGKPIPFRWFPPADPTDGTDAVELRNRIDLDRQLARLAAAIRLGGLLGGRPLPIVRDDLLYGVVTGTAMGGQASGIPGISGFADGSVDRRVHRNTPAHEVAHMLGRHHSVNSVYGFIVQNGIRAKVGPCKTFASDAAPDFPMDLFDGEPMQPVLGPTTQGIYQLAYGWDAGLNEYVSPFQTPDLMSYCEFKSGWAWPSLTTHAALFDALRSRYGIRPNARLAGIAPAGDGLLVSGDVALDGSEASLYPVVELPAGSPATPPEEGPWTVRLLAGSGESLWEQPFLPETEIAEAGETARTDGSFELILPRPESLATVEITHAGIVRARYTVSSHAPTVLLTRAALVADNLELTWDAADADGDALLATVEYRSDDGGEWTPVAADYAGTSLEFPIHQFAGTQTGRFRVTVTDGFHRTTSQPSTALVLPDQAPVVAIENPPNHSIIQGDQDLILRANALDLEDLDGLVVEWQSQLNGVLGHGAELVYDTAGLDEGTHQLTATVRDRQGQSAMATIEVEIHHRPGVALSVRQESNELLVSWPIAFATWQLSASTQLDSPYWFAVEAPAVEESEVVTVRLPRHEDDEVLFLKLSAP